METEVKMAAALLVPLLLLLPAALAAPAITGVSLQPQKPWLGNPVTIFLSCTDDQGFGIAQVAASIAGPGILLPPLNFSQSATGYALQLDPFYLSQNGPYTATLRCVNSQGENASLPLSFTVSILGGRISSISPAQLFLGNPLDIGFFVLEDGVPVQPPSTVSFQVHVNGAQLPLLQLPYFSLQNGWILKVPSPPAGEPTSSRSRPSTKEQRSATRHHSPSRIPLSFLWHPFRQASSHPIPR